MRSRRWFVPGDVNGFFGLVVDNLAVTAFLATVLVGGFGFPADIVFERMLPGTALGVLLGDAVYAFMARRLARREGRDDVTAMPLGLDTPSTIGMVVLVLGPAFLAYQKAGLDVRSAATATWYLGMAATVVMGVTKVALSFAGAWVQNAFPRAALLGSIAAIAVALIGFLPLLDVMEVPVVGFVTLGIVLYALFAGGRMPLGLPGVLVAFLAGTALYYGLGAAGLGAPGYHAAAWPVSAMAFPIPTLGFVRGLHDVVAYLPLVVPFALLTGGGGVNVCESARARGDDYSTRDILLTEAIATLLAGLCGGVAQTTPYIGQPAYKDMGARSGYALAAGLFIGLGGIFGYLAGIVQLIPLAVLSPILVFVAINITVQAFSASPPRHAPAVTLSFFPALAQMLAIKLGDPTIVPPAQFARLMAASQRGFPELAVIVMLGNGFIITSMIWGAFLASMIDARLRRAAAYLVAGAALSAFGFMHSVLPNGGIYLPWTLPGAGRALCENVTAAYALLALTIFALSLQRPSRSQQIPADA